MPVSITRVKQRVATPSYKVDGIPELEGVQFTNSSPDSRDFSRAVEFAAGLEGQVLWSAQEAVAFRYAALAAGKDGFDNANNHQWTRTASIYFKSEGETWYVAFDDISDARENIVLAKAQEGYESHRTRGKFPLSMRTELVKSTLKRADKNDRIIAVPESNLELELLTKPTDVQNSVAGNIQANILLGYAAPLQAKFLNKKGYEKGCFYLLQPSDLERLNLKKNQAEIRAVRLGEEVYNILNYVGAYCGFDSPGHAAGVVGAKKFQRK